MRLKLMTWMVVLALLLLLSAVGFWFYHTRPYERSPHAYVTWQATGKPGYIDWEVVDSESKPKLGASLEVWNSSGSRCVLLDDDGRARSFGDELIEIKLNGVRVLHRPWADTFNNPSAGTNGLAVKIVMLDRAAFAR